MPCWQSSEYITCLLLSLVQAMAIFRLPFCSSLIEHSFCDVQPFGPACATLIINDILTLIISLLIITASSFLMSSASAEDWKTFTTYACASHLTMIFICISIAYFKPKSKNTRAQHQLISVIYTVTILLPNPVVYSLRTKKSRMLCGKCWVQNPFLKMIIYSNNCICFPHAKL